MAGYSMSEARRGGVMGVVKYDRVDSIVVWGIK